MNHWMVQPNAVAAGENMKFDQAVVCPKPRRVGRGHVHVHNNHPVRSLRYHFSHQMELFESKAETDILDIILMKDEFGEEEIHTTQVKDSSTPPPFFCGSPPSRVSNPLTQDDRFRDEINFTMVPSSSPRKSGGCFRKFGSSPSVRIEGFDCFDRDSRNCRIPTLA